MGENYRAYFFCNMYLSSIQQGIQSAHVLGEMFNKYQLTKSQILLDWARRDKTIIIFNGGNSLNLQTIKNNFYSIENVFPWASFKEDEDSLNGALTCVGIILPQEVYTIQKPRMSYWGGKMSSEVNFKNKFETELTELLKISTLAK